MFILCTFPGMSNKSSSGDLLGINSTFQAETKVVYMNEDAMDCVYTESNDTLKDSESIYEAPSPDMFGSDTEDAPKNDSGIIQVCVKFDQYFNASNTDFLVKNKKNSQTCLNIF